MSDLIEDIQKLKQYHDELANAKKIFEQRCQELFPVGSKIYWIHGNHVQTGEVLRHCGGGDFYVKNIYTGSEYRIDAYKIILFLRGY